ncbi:MAG: hypothetical protein MN733_17490 [Nitrososphaera sp.]|nr:hypothetical protein [Nitrososphaera sp.]
MELERPRKMELLYTPKSELAKLMRENSLTLDEVMFLHSSNKVSTLDIRTNAPSICDKLLNMVLRRPENPDPKVATAVAL